MNRMYNIPMVVTRDGNGERSYEPRAAPRSGSGSCTAF